MLRATAVAAFFLAAETRPLYEGENCMKRGTALGQCAVGLECKGGKMTRICKKAAKHTKPDPMVKTSLEVGLPVGKVGTLCELKGDVVASCPPGTDCVPVKGLDSKVCLEHAAAVLGPGDACRNKLDHRCPAGTHCQPSGDTGGMLCAPKHLVLREVCEIDGTSQGICPTRTICKLPVSAYGPKTCIPDPNLILKLGSFCDTHPNDCPQGTTCTAPDTEGTPICIEKKSEQLKKGDICDKSGVSRGACPKGTECKRHHEGSKYKLCTASNPCDKMKCSSGTTCVLNKGAPKCVDINLAAGGVCEKNGTVKGTCPSGMVCTKRHYTDSSKICKIPDPCDGTKCGPGTRCKPDMKGTPKCVSVALAVGEACKGTGCPDGSSCLDNVCKATTCRIVHCSAGMECTKVNGAALCVKKELRVGDECEEAGISKGTCPEGTLCKGDIAVKTCKTRQIMRMVGEKCDSKNPCMEGLECALGRTTLVCKRVTKRLNKSCHQGKCMKRHHCDLKENICVVTLTGDHCNEQLECPLGTTCSDQKCRANLPTSLNHHMDCHTSDGTSIVHHNQTVKIECNTCTCKDSILTCSDKRCILPTAFTPQINYSLSGLLEVILAAGLFVLLAHATGVWRARQYYI
eukprot:TRINITY_DN1122_c0_g5_i1.p1 TRINITY_DN1122_c0_g5~~TRINITY_DN1122_c0_g5_i1.p1  ORF type:complete len:629 (+),score=90.45 TRINITY_DN1122_c0_g5_i1:91-1977(+)